MEDILLYETGSGGDFLISGNDLTLGNMLPTQIYIRLFGGNYEASTRGDEIASQVRNDWWGNSLLYGFEPQKRFNSETERVLNSVPLNSSGRIQIETAVINDLKGLEDICTSKVDVVINSNNKVTIYITVNPLDNSSEKRMQIVWDNLRKEVILNETI